MIRTLSFVYILLVVVTTLTSSSSSMRSLLLTVRMFVIASSQWLYSKISSLTLSFSFSFSNLLALSSSHRKRWQLKRTKFINTLFTMRFSWMIRICDCKLYYALTSTDKLRLFALIVAEWLEWLSAKQKRLCTSIRYEVSKDCWESLCWSNSRIEIGFSVKQTSKNQVPFVSISLIFVYDFFFLFVPFVSFRLLSVFFFTSSATVC